MKKIAVLISYYNGSNYIDDQIESIFAQTYNNIDIFIRNDGSDDYCDKFSIYDNVHLINGENVGVAESFIKLLLYVHFNYKYDYYAFCDQDDYWLPEKIEKAINKLEDNNKELYLSNTTLVDSKLEEIGMNIPLNEPIKKNIIFTNSFQGNTFVFRHTFIENNLMILKKINYKKVLMHDTLIYHLALINNSIYFDSNSYILYRQHSGNVIGYKKKNNFDKVRLFIKKIKKAKKQLYYNYFAELNEMCNDNRIKEMLYYYNKFFIFRLYYLLKIDYSKISKKYKIKFIFGFIFHRLDVVL